MAWEIAQISPVQFARQANYQPTGYDAGHGRLTGKARKVSEPKRRA